MTRAWRNSLWGIIDAGQRAVVEAAVQRERKVLAARAALGEVPTLILIDLVVALAGETQWPADHWWELCWRSCLEGHRPHEAARRALARYRLWLGRPPEESGPFWG